MNAPTLAEAADLVRAVEHALHEHRARRLAPELRPFLLAELRLARRLFRRADHADRLHFAQWIAQANVRHLASLAGEGHAVIVRPDGRIEPLEP